MFHFKVLLVLTICLSWSYGKLDNYCKLCADHTMCLYRDVGKDCEDVGGFGVTEEEKREILDVHNWVRRIVASGHEKRGTDGPQPKGANLMKLEWDNELSKVAQKWADQCRFQHDVCRDDPRWKVGQNIFWKWRYPTHHVNWTEAIISWYDEVSLYNSKDVESYRHADVTGHYTQLLWHNTYKIGCGRRDYGANKLYICNYGPAGNWLEEPMYAVGEPCSKCPSSTYCDEYLCANLNANGRKKLENHEAHQVETNVITQAPTEEKSPATKNPPSNPLEDKSKDIIGMLRTLLDNMNLPKKESVIDEDHIELDLETKSAIEEIKIKITKLIKKVIRRCRSQ